MVMVRGVSSPRLAISEIAASEETLTIDPLPAHIERARWEADRAGHERLFDEVAAVVDWEPDHPVVSAIEGLDRGVVAEGLIGVGWGVGDDEQKRGSGQPRSKTLHCRNPFIVIRLRHNQLERSLLLSFAEKRGKENDEKHHRSDRHDCAADAAKHSRIAPISMIQVRLRIGVTHPHVGPAWFAPGTADEQAGGKNHDAERPDVHPVFLAGELRHVGRLARLVGMRDGRSGRNDFAEQLVVGDGRRLGNADTEHTARRARMARADADQHAG